MALPTQTISSIRTWMCLTVNFATPLAPKTATIRLVEGRVPKHNPCLLQSRKVMVIFGLGLSFV
jgi:hypothetical protein